MVFIIDMRDSQRHVEKAIAERGSRLNMARAKIAEERE